MLADITKLKSALRDVTKQTNKQNTLTKPAISGC